MALELIVNILLMAGSVFCWWYVGATMPKSAASELGAEQWPQFLLFLLVIALAINIFNFFKRNKKEAIAQSFVDFLPGIGKFVKSKLFIGMVMLMVMAVLYEPLGFFATCLLFLLSYGILLGEKRPLFLGGMSIGITFLLYVGFSVLLGIMLPRGYVPFLRSFALVIESIFQ
ncbi:hypothetical protein AGMMS50212_05610 [Spirochaetia bacterium]|nr:hypothetical protein AGMMS50212_05610 [Spirochaetia bacterium]